ncbi:ENPP4 (predicted) [Pycnogonum litorale]
MTPTPLLLLVLFDGFGHELFQQHYRNFGNLTKLYESSAKTRDGMVPVFPTVTYSSLTSIATGLYTETHGIMWNDMDPKPDEIHKVPLFRLFSPSDDDETWWDNGINLPIWTLNELADTSRFSGSMMYTGAGASYRKHRIKYYKHQNGSTDWNLKVDTVMDWFTDKEGPANCVFLYFDSPDETQHRYGPNSEEVVNEIVKIDETVGYLMHKIKVNGLQNKLNLIFVSDHGDSEIRAENIIELNKFVKPDAYNYTGGGTVWNIEPLPNQFDYVYSTLLNGSRYLNFTVWKKEDFPVSAHYKNNRRVAPIILVSDPGYVTYRYKFPNVSAVRGTHGYNNTFSTMRSIFFAQGPAFNSSATIDSFHSVDLFPLMCSILELEPSPNNGSLENVSRFLIDSESSSGVNNKSKINVPASMIGLALALMSVTAIGFFACRMIRSKSDRLKKERGYDLVNENLISDSDSDDLS